MLRKILAILILTVMVVVLVSGCKKDSSQTEQNVKTAAEYKAEAEEQINKENMASELDELEKTLEQEISQEQE